MTDADKLTVVGVTQIKKFSESVPDGTVSVAVPACADQQQQANSLKFLAFASAPLWLHVDPEK